ncbi:MAG TPA: CDP-diacylglycerol--serine O-phosphatidyltransferase [Desulfitobacterium dehalogenans]|uniref:CDP-diacylglycerol--serine O-phosphatidyltransferase n=1 Tax=Desulfitobacterium dehalogenans TaxID=36854 RepID=A0A7C7DA52_9FIRM|nr:CDP-diacylglycerol--serine O-phosphatidyltransferase [Desulfitobacterium dehalogenans]
MSGKSIKVDMIPSVFTLGNLFFGFLAILWTMNGEYKMAAGFILFSVLMDSMDGKVARKLSVSSDFGKELDSLCDVVSFGVAPAVLTYKVLLAAHMGFWGILLAAAFVMCGAVRLARFNILNITTHFLGVPITFAGGLMALLILFHKSLPWVIFPVVLAILAFLMVSTIKVPKLGK